MNILLIGGQGFVGQYLIKELQKDVTTNITVISRKIHKNLFLPFNDKIKVFGDVDILDKKSMIDFFQGQDIVINLAGYISFKQCDKGILEKINNQGALNVLSACEESGVKKLIHLSSTAALGFSDKLIDENQEFDWSKHKKCVYSISKAMSNKKISESKSNTIIVYPSLILGPGDKTNTKKLLCAVRDRKIPFNPPGTNSIVDVRDLAKALTLLVSTKNIDSGKYIVSGGSYSFKELNSEIAKSFRVKAPRLTLPKFMSRPLLLLSRLLEKFSDNPPITYENIYLSFKQRNHDTSCIQNVGFIPEYSLAQTIEDSREWIQTRCAD